MQQLHGLYPVCYGKLERNYDDGSDLFSETESELITHPYLTGCTVVQRVTAVKLAANSLLLEMVKVLTELERHRQEGVDKLD